jgi:uracil-DNA glycosylase
MLPDLRQRQSGRWFAILGKNIRALRGVDARMILVSDAYNQLLNATIEHLEDLKAHGVRFVRVSPESLAGLNQDQQRVSAKLPGASYPPAPQTAQMTAAKMTPQKPKTGEAKPVAERALSFSLPSQSVMAPATSVLSADARAAAFAELRQRAMVCVKCPHLAKSRKNVVFGVGDINAQLLFIGEAPGADEDEQSEPFVGKAGQLLTKIIQTAGLSRESVYIANILKCRPDTPGQSAGNRKPTPEEMQTCIPYLHEQIDLIGPKVIVALGATAVEGLLGKTIGITKLRGQWRTYRGIPLMPTYHPAYLLRNQALSEKRRVWEDMLQVMEKLEMPISEKQRRFFLQGTA